MSQAEAGVGQAYVWRANRTYRIGAIVVSAVLIVLSIQLLASYGWLAALGVVLVLSAVARTYWVLVRPSLTAGPAGVRVVWGRAPVQLEWREIRRVEPTVEGLKIVCSGGREVLARYPQQPPRPASEPSEAQATAAYLAQRAAWARKPSGPEPVYTPPAAPARPARA